MILYILLSFGLASFIMVSVYAVRNIWLSPTTNEEKKEQARQDAIKKEARRLEDKAGEILAKQNRFARHWEYTPEGKKKKRIRFRTIYCTDTQIYLLVEWKHMPYGVSYADLLDDNKSALKNLTYGLRRECAWYETEKLDLFLVIGLRSAVLGIPKIVHYKNMVKLLPDNRRFATVVGLDNFSRPKFLDITHAPHIFVGGTTQTGKSVFITQTLITWLSRNDPSWLNLILFDFKEGSALRPFRKIKHCTHYTESTTEAIKHLEWLLTERERRQKILTNNGYEDLEQYNSDVPDSQRIPWIFLIVDELSALTQSKETRSDAFHALETLAQRSRSAGIHMLLSTQIMDADVMSKQLRGNIPVKIAFPVPLPQNSISMIGDGSASTLGIKGRCVYARGMDRPILQTPLATHQERDAIIKSATEGQASNAPFATLDLWRIVINEHNHQLVINDLVANKLIQMSNGKIRETIKRHQFSIEKGEPLITIDDQKYILTPYYRVQGGTIPRMLLPIDTLPKSEEELRVWVDLFTNDAQMTGQEIAQPETIENAVNP